MNNIQPYILIVDDDLDWCKRIAFPLERENYNVIITTGRKEAIDALNTYKIDLICLDVLLQGDIPEWNQDWEILLEEAKHRKISVIAITAVNGMNKSYIWTLPTRIFHILLALFVLIAFLTNEGSKLLNYHAMAGYVVGIL